MAVRIAFVGKKSVGKTYAAHYLYKRYGFKHLRMVDATHRVIKWFYKYRPYKRIKWERQIEFYDALYALDPDIHIDHILRRLETTTRDVVIDDPRYINEVKKLKEAGFIIIRLNMRETKRVRLAGISNASSGTVKLNEYYAAGSDAYPVDYSIINENRESLFHLLDNIVEKERAKQSE